jgi:hypothetical protein
MKWFLLFIFFTLPAYSVTVSVSFNSYEDTTLPTTCDWDKINGRLRARLEVNTNALDFGDGSDGNCNFSGTITAREFNCRTLNISSSARFTGNNPLIIRVQGNASISGTLNVNGFNGRPSGSETNLGADGGPGGFKGGDFDFGFGSDGSSNAFGGDAGFAGGAGLSDSINPASGGGGSGASFRNGVLGAIGEDGDSASPAGFGGAQSNANNVNAENTFQTLLIGGAGGGAGGAGENIDFTQAPAASGGGGGGAVHIVARGSITVTGTITANGGDGGNATGLAGAGGGGAGGAVWLQSASSVINNGIIRAAGGSGGTNTSASPRGGNGGGGGAGRIRIDSFDGTLTGTVTNPTAQTSSGVTGINTVTFETGINCLARTTAIDTIGKKILIKDSPIQQTLNGGTIQIQVEESSDGVTWSAPVDISLINTLNQRYLRFTLDLQSTSASLSPVLSNISINYDILEKSDTVLKSDITCGTLGGPDDPNSQGPMILSFIFGLLLTLTLKRRSRSD